MLIGDVRLRVREIIRQVCAEMGVTIINGALSKDHVHMFVELLKAQAKTSNQAPDAYVFLGQKPGKPLSQMAMTMVLRRMNLGHFTVHGMRSCFRDYMGDMTDHPESLVEQALAHQIGDETTRAYRRGDAFVKRRSLMQEWQDYLLPVQKRLMKKQDGINLAHANVRTAVPV